MGIPSYFSHLCRTYPEVIQEWNSKNQIDNLYLDSNSIVYDSLRSLEYQGNDNAFEEQLLDMVCATIDTYIKTVQPKKEVFICFDGVAPIAKLDQQRTRRFKSAFMVRLENELSTAHYTAWDKTAITPGTEFMTKLNHRLEQYTQPEHAAILGVDTIRVSSSEQAGEGEHKIFEYIRNTPDKHLRETTVIYGLDADLIVLSLNHLRYGRLYLFRETPSFVQNFSHLEPNQSYLLDIQRLSTAILTEMTGITLEPTAMAKMRMYDYILLTFLLGNDFLPHFPGICLRTRGMDILMDTYRQLFGRGAKMNTRTLCVKRDNGIQIHWATFREFIQTLAERERNDWLEEYKIREKWERMTIYIDSDDDDSTRIPISKAKPELAPKVGMAKLLHMPVKNRDTEKYIDPSKEGWQKRYYQILFETHPTLNQKKNICINYLEGLEWVLTYYSLGCKDWRWHYTYNYPPLLEDLQTFIPAFQQPLLQSNSTPPIHPVVQLMVVLPYSALHLLPEEIRTKIQNTPELRELYPREAEFIWSYCRYFWETHVKLPEIDIKMLETLI